MTFEVTPFVHSTSDVESGSIVGLGTKIWRFCHVMRGAQIGERCTLGQGCFVASGAVVGDDCRLQNHVSVFDGVTLEAFVFCGPSVTFTNVRTPRCEFSAPRRTYEKTLVGRGASLGANATVVCGTKVESYAMVGAGSVVTRDVPAFSLVVGNPARQIGWVSHAGIRLTFQSGRACCRQTGRSYVMDAQGRVTEAP